MSVRECTVRHRENQTFLFYFMAVVLGLFAPMAVAGTVNAILLDYLNAHFPLVDGFYSNAWVAALAEPFTTKLLPAMLTVAIWRTVTIKEPKCLSFTDHRVRVGALIGLMMGIGEIYVKIWTSLGQLTTPFVWELPIWSNVYLAPVLLHVVNGIIIAGTFFTLAETTWDRYDLIPLSGALLVAGAIHWTWNTWLVQQGWLWRMIP